MPIVLIGSAGICLGFFSWRHLTGPAPETAFARGLSAFHNADVDGIRSAVAALAGRDEYQPQRALLSGMYFIRVGEMEKALHVLRSAVESASTQELAFVCAGEALYRLDRLDEAIGALSNALRTNPASVDAHRWLAAIYYDMGTMDKALLHLEQVTTVAPDDPRPYRLRALIFNDFERYTEAIESYKKALSRTDSVEMASDIGPELAECYIKLLRFDEALDVLASCTESPKVLALRAECQYALGNSQPAEEILERALDLEPENLDALILKAGIALDKQLPELALESLETALRLAPQDHRVRLKLSQAYRLLGRDTDADRQLALMEKYRDLRTRFTDLHIEAMNDTSNADLRYQLGEVALQLGKPLLAERWFRSALSLDPGHENASTALLRLTAKKVIDPHKEPEVNE